jgi:hypothetical protein
MDMVMVETQVSNNAIYEAQSEGKELVKEGATRRSALGDGDMKQGVMGLRLRGGGYIDLSSSTGSPDR